MSDPLVDSTDADAPHFVEGVEVPVSPHVPKGEFQTGETPAGMDVKPRRHIVSRQGRDAGRNVDVKTITALRRELHDEGAAKQKDRRITMLHVGGKKPLAREFEPIDEEAIGRRVNETRDRERRRNEHKEALNSRIIEVSHRHSARFLDELTSQETEGTLHEEIVKKASRWEKLRGRVDEKADVATYGFWDEERGLRYEAKISSPVKTEEPETGYSTHLGSASTEIFTDRDPDSPLFQYPIVSAQADISEDSGLPADIRIQLPHNQLERFSTGGMLGRVIDFARQTEVREQIIESGWLSFDQIETIKVNVYNMVKPELHFSLNPENRELPLQLTISDSTQEGVYSSLVARFDSENDRVGFYGSDSSSPKLGLSGEEYTQLFDEALSVIPDNPQRVSSV